MGSRLILILLCFLTLAAALAGAQQAAVARRKYQGSDSQQYSFKKSVATSRHHSKSHAYQVTSGEALYLKNQLRRCDDGNGQACNEYGHMLMQLDRPGDHRMGMQYIRKACLMAYTPACNRPSPSEKALMSDNPVGHCGPDSGKMISLSPAAVSSPGARNQMVTRLTKGSVLERAGLRVGDVITKVNGAQVMSAGEVAEALTNGKALLEITRSGANVPLAIYCP